jgi:hypothetical protein
MSEVEAPASSNFLSKECEAAVGKVLKCDLETDYAQAPITTDCKVVPIQLNVHNRPRTLPWYTM